MEPIEIAHRIDSLCTEKGMSINKMLSACSLSKSVVDNLKKGSIPSADKIAKIASYFGVTTDYLLGNEQKNKPSPKEESLSNDESEVLKLFRQLNVGGQKLALAQLDTMLSIQEHSSEK